MAIGKDFTFTKNLEKGRLHTPKVCKVAKDYRDACEHCSSDIAKGTFVLCAEEVVSCSNGFGVRTVKTHRLCASCTADYIKATSVQTPEPTYEERQAEWVAKNNVKVGTKVRFTKGFNTAEDGSRCREHRDAKGIEGVVSSIEDEFLLVRIPSDGWAVPFTALEVIKEPTYKERQAEWVKANNVKAGTKVRVTRTFTADEDGSCCWKHDDLVGMTGTVDKYGIAPNNLGITMSDGNLRAIPYFALEVIKEPTYRPFKNDELNSLVGKVLTQKGCGYPCLVTRRYSMTQVCVNGDLYNAQELLELFALDGKPCGIKEEV